MVVSRLTLASPAEEGSSARLSDEVELYQRTYNTLLRSSGETALRVLESAHRQINSSLHPLAGSDEPDLGAFIYAIRRLPDGISGARLVIMGQEAEVFARNGIVIDDWEEADAPARRRRWHDAGDGAPRCAGQCLRRGRPHTHMVAFQIEWNKLRVRRGPALAPTPNLADGMRCALGGRGADGHDDAAAWGERFSRALN